ncbi:MAG: hypothetical protein DRH30_03205 [Deltaproteobacteria bacterium]|nr:MAG: hypothetical protein DRH30_03205 [Deltaproteobacteria bacterium]
MSIASTIKSQLGGMALKMMGAHALLDHGNGLSFKFKGSPKANYLKITLDPSDTYSVEFQKIGRAPAFEGTNKKVFEDIYVGMLHELIEANTGLYLSL